MERLNTGLYLLLLFLITFFSCEKKEIVPSSPEPRLRGLTVQQEGTVMLAHGATVEIHFVVEDAAYAFSTRVDEPGCPIRLISSNTTCPEEVKLQSVKAVPGQEGHYVAVIADTKTRKDYEYSLRLAIFVSDDTFLASGYFSVKSESLAEPWQKTGLPVVYVDTKGGVNITSKTTYVQANAHIDGTKEYPSLPQASCRIRGRGNTTWTWPKKPYLIAFDEQQSVLGMPRHKRWVLLANFMDRTLMRNLVSMKVATFTSLAWTPRCVPVELVLNGKHKGSYLLIEQVRVDKDRVNISKEEGYLLELDFHYDNEFQWKERNIPFAVKYPDPEDLTPTQKTYIKNYIKEVSNAIYGNDFKDSGKGYARYLDIDSFIDEWIVYEVMCNHELGNPGSVFFHKDKDGLLTAGPVWDFDWGVLSFYTSAGETRLVNGKAIWYERLFQDPAFKERVKARFYELLPQLETIPAYMDECEALLTESAKLNFKMWNPADDRSQNGGQIINGDENLSFHDAVQRLKHNYEKHLQVIQDKL